MKKVIYMLLFAVLTQACSQVIDDRAEGYLHIGKVELASDVTVEPLALRAVHSSLQLDIYQGDVCVQTFAAADPALSAPVALPVGHYRLEAHTANMSEPTDGSAGEPTYFVAHDFSIQLNQTTTVPALKALRTNVGVSVIYDPKVVEAFTEIRCVVSSVSGREVSISGFTNQAVHYFDMPSDKKLTYVLHCKNQDGELFTMPAKEISVSGPENYKIKVSL